ncbi:MAG: Stp1/IreP family PP2C-type Ser/Thr phosphatase [Gemmatimonadota bacterium]
MSVPMRTPPEVRAARLASEGDHITVDIYAITDVGRTREHNEDAFVVSDLARGTPLDFGMLVQQRVGTRGVLFMVADGMGGAAAGELASATAVDVVLRFLREHWTSRDDGANAADFVIALEDATQTANGVIFRYASEHTELRGMGTTSTIAGLLGDTLYLAQVGDSRAYLVRDGVTRQLTKDQSLIQKLVEAGEITEEEAEVSERRNIILQALGPEAQVKIDLTHQQVRRRDVLVLCSDGLSGLVKPEEIGKAVRESPDLAAACHRLVALANDQGGPDNITVVAARFDGAGLAPAAPTDAVGHQTYISHDRLGKPTEPVEAYLRERTEELIRRTPFEAPEATSSRDARMRRVRWINVALAVAATVLAVVMVLRLLRTG